LHFNDSSLVDDTAKVFNNKFTFCGSGYAQSLIGLMCPSKVYDNVFKNCSTSGTSSLINSSITTANPVLTTTYTAIGTNGVAPNLCSSSSTLQILVIQNPTITAAPKQIICEGQTTLIYANGATNYTWSPSSGVDDINDSTTYINPVGSGVFIYTVTGSNNNCTSTATVEVLVNPLPIVNAGVDTTINIDNTVTLIGIGNTSVGFINASDGTPFSCNYCPTVTVNPQNSTCYTLEGINEFGCRATDVVCVTVTKDWSVFIPNAFTPNGDIHNEVFIPMGYAIDEIKLTIYDRWGHVVFKSNDTVIGWDGTKNGKICEQGVYVYQAEITAMSGEKVIRTGHVTLLGKTK
jgi:gliding motility-associated-like protein